MQPEIIRTDEEHRVALARLEILMDAERGSPEESELEILALSVERYEKERFPIGVPDGSAA